MRGNRKSGTAERGEPFCRSSASEMALEVHNPRSMKINLACASPEKELRAAESQRSISPTAQASFFTQLVDLLAPPRKS